MKEKDAGAPGGVMDKYRAGLLGEWRAARHARKMGMKILARRYRAARGEIDLIARDGAATVFIEVKYRPRGEIGDGLRAVHRAKQARIRAAAKVYLSSHPSDDVRFDVIEISASGARVVKNAF